MKSAMNEIFERLKKSGLNENDADALIARFLQEEASDYISTMKAVENLDLNKVAEQKELKAYDELIAAMIKKGFSEQEACDLFKKAHEETCIVDNFYSDLATIMPETE